MLQDTWEEDYMNYVECNDKALCSGLAFRGRVNRLEHAQQMNALIFDLDSVGENELMTLFKRLSDVDGLRRMPYPTFIVQSGSGLHIYYVFDEPILLFPNIKLQLKALKHDLTFKLWDYKGTTQEKNIQYQPLNQAFRMVGSHNNKYDLQVRAFRTGETVSIEHLNQFVMEEHNKVDINQKFSPTKYSLEEAQVKFPEWYEKVIVQGIKQPNKWRIKRDLYDWWKRQYSRITGGHRYYFLMCIAIYAVKCDISRQELKQDMDEMFEYLRQVEHTNPLEESDIISALEAYDRAYYNFTLDDIEKLTNLRIERNKRNYRTQGEHMKVMSAIRDVFYPNGDWRNAKGAPTKEQLVKDYLAENPTATVTEVARALGVSRPTVYKYMKKE